MKIRNGYVSNSSSSSFLIIGRKIDYNDIKDGDLIYVEGKELCDGKDIFILDKNIKSCMDLIDNKKINLFTFYKAKCPYIALSEDFYLYELPDIQINEHDHLFEVEKDYNSTIDASDFKSTYSEYFEKDEYNYSTCSYNCEKCTFIGNMYDKNNILNTKCNYEKMYAFLVITKNNKDYYISVKINNKDNFIKIYNLIQSPKIEFEFFDVECFINLNGNCQLKEMSLKNQKIFELNCEHLYSDINEFINEYKEIL